MRPANIYEVQPPITIVSNTASAASANRPFLRTSSSSTNFIVADATAHTVTFSLKTVGDGGTAVQAMADICVAGSASNLTALSSSSGTIVDPLPDSIIAVTAGAAGAWLRRYSARIITDSTTGIATAVYTFAGAATVTCAVRYGNIQVIASVSV